MPMKRATKKLEDAGIEGIEIHKGMYGYSARFVGCPRQSSKVHKTVDAAVAAVLQGERPERL